jgi:hypothetical protein
MACMQPEWNFHYPRWVIEDGQPNRHLGEIFTWPEIEFSAKLVKVLEQPKSAIPFGDYLYRVVAEVTYFSEQACIVDFGIKATSFSTSLTAGCKLGDYVAGDVALYHSLNCIVLPDEAWKTLAYMWRVNGISADLTAYLPHPDDPRHLVRDDSHIHYEAVSSTDSLHTHTYILNCSEMPMSD